MEERLNKWLSRAGVTSRRGADRLIVEGRVTVNGDIVRTLGVRVDPLRDAVKVDGRRIAATPPAPVYVMLHKPRGVVTTLRDPEGRTTVVELLRGLGRRVFPVGRLDFHSEGLLLLTDDGELARDLMHPSRHVPKVYAAKVRGRPDPEALRRLAVGGLEVDGRPTLPARTRLLRVGPTTSWVELTLTEGRKHQVRRMLEQVGHPVLKLKRTRYGPLELGPLPAGRWRRLTDSEVAGLRRSPGQRAARRSRGRSPGQRN